HLPPGESHTNFRYLSGGVLSAAGNIRPDPYRAGTDERLRNPRQRIDAPASIVTKARHLVFRKCRCPDGRRPTTEAPVTARSDHQPAQTISGTSRSVTHDP